MQLDTKTFSYELMENCPKWEAFFSTAENVHEKLKVDIAEI